MPPHSLQERSHSLQERSHSLQERSHSLQERSHSLQERSRVMRGHMLQPLMALPVMLRDHFIVVTDISQNQHACLHARCVSHSLVTSRQTVKRMSTAFSKD